MLMHQVLLKKKFAEALLTLKNFRKKAQKESIQKKSQAVSNGKFY